MRVLVTGSSGFIGSHQVRVLVDLGHSVRGLDVKHPPHGFGLWEYPSGHGQAPGTTLRGQADCPEGVRFCECDILDGPRLQEALWEFSPQAVIHLAARTDLDEKADLHDYAANITGVENLVAAVRATESVGRCIYTSSQLVCRPGYTPETDEDYRPHTVYGESKVLGEKIVRKSDGGGVSWCIVRPTTVWGPGMHPHYQRFLKMVSEGRYFHVGRRPLWKSYGYVGNVVHQYARLLDATAVQIHSKTFYLADYQPLSLRKWVSMLGCELGTETMITLPEGVAHLLARCGDLINTCGYRKFPFNSFRLNNVLTEYRVDTDEAEMICGPLPYTMEQGVTEMAGWYRQTILNME